MCQGFAANTLRAQIGVETDEDWLEPACEPLMLVNDADTDLAPRTAVVFFPVVLPGDGGPVIPFGRYDLVLSPMQKSPNGWADAVRGALIDRDGGEWIPLSAEHLDAFTQDPDVEIF